MLRSVAVVGLLAAGCSWTTVRPSHASDPTSCTSTTAAPVVDTLFAAAFVGLAAFVAVFPCASSAQCDQRWTGVAEMTVFATPFALSAYYGFSRTADCRRASEADGPAERERRARCVADRTSLYSALATLEGHDRLVAAQTLPSCPAVRQGDIAEERAWQLTRTAIVAALQGDCTTVDRIAGDLEQTAPTHHARVMLWQPDIAACLATRERRADDCRADRIRRQREAQAIPDLEKRAAALQKLPECRS